MIALALLAVSFAAPPPHLQWVMLTAEWCPACAVAKADFKPWMEKSRWRVSQKFDAHVRLVDVDIEPDALVKYRADRLPTFILLRDGTEIERAVGYPGRRRLPERYLAEFAK